MSHKATAWAWDTPATGGVRRYILLALAERANTKTNQCTPSLPELAKRTGIAESSVRTHLRGLEAAGLIDVDVTHGGRRKRSTYTLRLDRSPGTFGETRREPVGNDEEETHREASTSEEETHREPSTNPPGAGAVGLRPNTGTREPGTTGAADASPAQDPDGLFAVRDQDRIPETLNQTCQRLAKAYCDRVPLSRFPAVMSIAKKAVSDAHYDPDDVEAALIRLAKEERTVTIDSLRVELNGFGNPRPQQRRGPTTGDDRAVSWQSLKTGTDDVRALPQRGANWR